MKRILILLSTAAALCVSSCNSGVVSTDGTDKNPSAGMPKESGIRSWSWTFSYAKGTAEYNEALASRQSAWPEDGHRLWSDQGQDAYITTAEAAGKTAERMNTWTFYNGHPYVKGIYFGDWIEFHVPHTIKAGEKVVFSGSMSGSGSAAGFFLAEYSLDGGQSWRIASGADEVTINGNTFACHSAPKDSFAAGDGDFSASFTANEDSSAGELLLRLRSNANYRITRNNATASNPITTGGGGSNRLRGACSISITPVRSTDVQRKDIVRLLYWNIQYGMWADQANGYDNFVNWIKEVDPDICVFCEASSKYDTGTYDTTPAGQLYLPEHWGELASRYGHGYTAIGGHHDRCPQEVTSKYPIETLMKITVTEDAAKPIAHGAGLHKVSVKGHDINILTAHLWPKSYAKGVAEEDQKEDAAAHGGDYYRQYEMQWLVKNTVNNKQYASDDWIVLGDMNSYSRRDNFHYGLPEDDTQFLAQDAILEGTNLTDLISSWYEGVFVPTHLKNIRIDYVYLSEALYGSVRDAEVLGACWAPLRASGVSPLYEPSDHKPIIVDFVLK